MGDESTRDPQPEPAANEAPQMWKVQVVRYDGPG